MRFDTHIPVKIKDAYAARHEPEALRILGGIYWAFLIVFLGVVVTGSIAFGIWEFMTPLEAAPATDVTIGTRKGLSRNDLNKILEGFDMRRKQYDNRKISPILVRDPS